MSLVRDGIALSGLGIAIYGIASYSPSLAYVVGGSVLITAAFGWSFIRSKA